MNILNRYRNANPRNEGGYSFVEIVMVVGLVSLLTMLGMALVGNASTVATAFNDKEMGVNQGVVMDEVQDIHAGASNWLEDNPDAPREAFTKEALIADGYVSPSSDLIWNVALGGVRGGVSTDVFRGDAVCVVGYSLERQAGRYMRTAPAEVNENYSGTQLGSPGCWIQNEEGSWVSIANS